MIFKEEQDDDRAKATTVPGVIEERSKLNCIQIGRLSSIKNFVSL